jgi:hypothetical protein
VTDHRDPRGKRWKLHALLWASLLGMLTGQKSLADVERLTCDLSKPIRHRFGIRRRIPDTTLRDALGTIMPSELRPILHSVTRSAIRSKSIAVDVNLPFGIVSMDGKYVTVPSVDGHYAQRSSRADDDSGIAGRIGTMTATLCSSEARLCIDVYLIPSKSNEMGVFAGALDALLAAYGNLDLFRLVTYDAGSSSLVLSYCRLDRSPSSAVEPPSPTARSFVSDPDSLVTCSTQSSSNDRQPAPSSDRHRAAPTPFVSWRAGPKANRLTSR